MATYKVLVSDMNYGTVIVEADSKAEAEEKALEVMREQSELVEWDGGEMDIHDVEPL